MRSSGDCRCGLLDRGADAGVGAAAADVAGHRGVDLRVVRALVALEQRGRTHDLPALAVAALRHIERDPGVCHSLADTVIRQTFDGGDPRAGRCRDRRRAAANRLAVHVNRAGAALCETATELGTSQAEVVAHRPKNRRARIGVDRHLSAVEGKCVAHRQGFLSSSSISLAHHTLALHFLQDAILYGLFRGVQFVHASGDAAKGTGFRVFVRQMGHSNIAVTATQIDANVDVLSLISFDERHQGVPLVRAWDLLLGLEARLESAEDRL